MLSFLATIVSSSDSVYYRSDAADFAVPVWYCQFNEVTEQVVWFVCGGFVLLRGQ